MAKERLQQEQRKLLCEALIRTKRDSLITPHEKTILRTATTYFHVHPPVLQAGSTYFKAVFDDSANLHHGLFLDEVDDRSLDIILDFLYTGSLDTLDEGNSAVIIRLLYATKFLGVELLYRYCCEVLVNNFGIQDLGTLWESADENGYDEVKDEILKYAARNLRKVAMSSDLLNILTAADVGALLDHPDLRATTDRIISVVLDQGLALTSQEKVRVMNATVLSCKDSDTFSDATLANLVDWADCHNSGYFLQRLKPYCAERLLSSQKPPPLPGQNLICFRKLKHPSLVDIEDFMSMYNIQDASWSTPKKMPFSIDVGMTVVRCKDSIYFIGGANHDETLLAKTVYEYSPNLNAITAIGKLDSAVYLASAGVLYNHIYILGGWRWGDDGVVETSRVVQKYSPSRRLATNVSWTITHPNTPFVTSVKQCLFVVDLRYSTVEQYDSYLDSWTVVRMELGGSAWGATVLGQKLYILQQQNPRQLEVYDMFKDSWTNLLSADAPMLMPGLWTLPPAKEDKPPLLLLRDQNYGLHTLNPETGEWDALDSSCCTPDEVFCAGLYDTLWINLSD